MKGLALVLCLALTVGCAATKYQTQPAGPQGPAGTPGDPGPTGPQGQQGPAGPVATTTTTTLPPSPSTAFGTSCSGNDCIFTGALENVATTASCSSGVITVVSATYGAGTHNESCLAYAASTCNGLASCALTFSNTNCLADPDVGTYKGAFMEVTCAPSQSQIEVQQQVVAYNQYREALGQEPITQGLTCNLYTVPTTTIGITAVTNGGVAPVLTNIGSFLYTGQFNVPNSPVTGGFPILPTALQPLYQTWFIVKCTGDIVIPTSAWYEFDTTSDDGANFYVDGTLVVNNDGLHSVQQKFGAKFLQANVHSVEVDFFQGGGNQALIINMNNALLNSYNLYH
jgi:hypothetical protein